MNDTNKTPRKKTKRTLSFLGKTILPDEPEDKKSKPATARVSGPYYDANVGSYRLVIFDGNTRKSIRTATEDEALRFKAQIEQTFRQCERTIGEVYKEFIEDKRRQGVKERTLETIQYKLSTFLPMQQTIGSFTPEQAQRLYTAETERISRFGTLIQAQTHRSSLKVSKLFFRWAVERKYVPVSPFERVAPIGKPNVGKKQLRIDESRRLTQVLIRACEKGEQGAIATLCQLFLGLRSGEVISREVRDLDDEGRILWIPSGKTQNARRRLEVPEALRPFLLRMVAGKSPEQLIFCGKRMKPLRYIWLWKQVRKYCQRANLPRVCPHSLRGLHSSLAMAVGCTSSAVASALGHGSFAVTAKHYVDPDMLHNSTVRRITGTLTAAANPDDESAMLLERLRALPAEVRSALLRAVAAETAN